MSLTVATGVLGESWQIQGEEMPTPPHRRGWRLIACSKGVWALIFSIGSFFLAVANLTMLCLASAVELPWLVVSLVLGTCVYDTMVKRLRDFAGFRFSPQQVRWIVHVLRLSGEDPDPLCLGDRDLLRAFRYDDRRMQADLLRKRLEAGTAAVQSREARRPARL